MGDPKTVLEGCVKYRDKKKWKARWAVISKLSPVADCLHLQLYRDSKERCKNGPTKASLSLEAFLGLETGFTLDKESNTLALICSELVVVLAFDSRELLIQWQVKIKANLTEEQQFLVQITHVPPKSKLPCGPARLHLQDYTFCLVSGVPPRLLATWPIKELRRFGVVEGKFCFEGGSLCGKGEGLHVLLTTQAEEVLQAMDLASKGKLLGKRKALSRKNSLLETSTRSALQKPVQYISEKCNTNESCRPLLSSTSDISSSCDACSEMIPRSEGGREDLAYNSAVSTKALSCQIHYRWPSCMSRWGQSSTMTTSDVESMDTVSVTLSDYQGPSHASSNSKPSSHGPSLLCLCEAQGTWPFNHCTKCGRQFYCRSSLGPNNAGKQKRPLSPENRDPDSNSGFSPQWTMNAALPSPSNERNGVNSKKNSAYQLMLPTSDRASLCSHTSRSSSTSTASSSGSEYSVPRNYLDSLYDKPRTLHSVLAKRIGVHNWNAVSYPQEASLQRNSAVRRVVPSEKERICPCHEPINNWMMGKDDQQKLDCSCWNQLSLSVLGDEVCGGDASSQSICTNLSPSLPKKIQNGNATSSSSTQLPCTCKKSSTQYTHYAVPRAALANIYIKENQTLSVKIAEAAQIIENPISPKLTEDYDVPKKYADILKSSDMILKSSVKTLDNSPCACGNVKKPTTVSPLAQPADAKIFRRYDQIDSFQMCTCQRLVLWAGSFVPCLGGKPSNSVDQGWQCTKGIGYPSNSARAVPNHYGTICCEPSRTTELMMNEKRKNVTYGPEAKELCPAPSMMVSGAVIAANAGKSKLAKPDEKRALDETIKGKEPSCTYVNIEFPGKPLTEENATSEDSSIINYANLDFAQNLPLYENSNIILTRLDKSKTIDPINEKPMLPPRGVAICAKKVNIPESASGNVNKTIFHVQLQPEKKLDIKKNSTNCIYELMNFEKTASASYEDDYLMMHPVYHDKSNEQHLTKEEKQLKSSHRDVQEASTNLPLRPFMPFSYPHFESNGGDDLSSELCKSLPIGVRQSGEAPIEAMTRRYHLINEDMELRSTRSNSLSELKKIVLLRKRSSSVDGKNSASAFDSIAKSNPASPSFSHKPTVQRKHSLFSKLNLRSKEKSMSTNEITPSEMLPFSPNFLNSYRGSNLHRSADCLKLNEEYANSDDDLSNDNDTPKYTVSMKRSCSVPCRSAMPDNFPSPRKTNVPAIPEINDLSKKSLSNHHISTDEERESMEREYCFEEKVAEIIEELDPFCDTTYKSNSVNATYKEGIEIQAAHTQSNNRSVENAPITILRKSTTSSSSDISDLIESLSHCSRSSSSSSSSSCNSDCLRVEDIFRKKLTNTLSAKNSLNSPPLTKEYPHVLFENSKISNLAETQQATKHSHPNDHCVTKSHMGSPSKASLFLESNSSLGHHINNESNCCQYHEHIPPNCSVPTHALKTYDPVTILNSSSYTSSAISTTGVNGSRMRNGSRSPTSSTSSLSTSPSITDYSSSSSGNCCISIPTLINDDALKFEQPSSGTLSRKPANFLQLRQNMLSSKPLSEHTICVDKGSDEGACSSTLDSSDK